MPTALNLGNSPDIANLVGQMALARANQELRGTAGGCIGSATLYLKDGAAGITSVSARQSHRATAIATVVTALTREHHITPDLARKLMHNVLGGAPQQILVADVRKLHAQGAQAARELQLAQDIKLPAMSDAVALDLARKAIAAGADLQDHMVNRVAQLAAHLHKVGDDGAVAVAKAMPLRDIERKMRVPADAVVRLSAKVDALVLAAQPNGRAAAQAHGVALAHAAALLAGPNGNIDAAWDRARQICAGEQGAQQDQLTPRYVAAAGLRQLLDQNETGQSLQLKLRDFGDAIDRVGAALAEMAEALPPHGAHVAPAHHRQWLRIADAWGSGLIPGEQFRAQPLAQRVSMMCAQAVRVEVCRGFLEEAPRAGQDRDDAKRALKDAYVRAAAFNARSDPAEMHPASQQARTAVFHQALQRDPAVQQAKARWPDMNAQARMALLQQVVGLHAQAFNYPVPDPYVVEMDAEDRQGGDLGQHVYKDEDPNFYRIAINTGHDKFRDFAQMLEIVAHESTHHCQLLLLRGPGEADQAQQKRMLQASARLEITKADLQEEHLFSPDAAHDAYAQKPNELHAFDQGESAVTAMGLVPARLRPG